MILSILVAFGVTAGLTWRFCHPASSLHLLDHPNERSLHNRPTPRSGGVAVLAGVAAGGAAAGAVYPLDPNWAVVLVSGLPVAIVSFVDDVIGVHAGVRILTHLAAAAVLLMVFYTPGIVIVPGGYWALPGVVEIAVAILFVVWMINLYNFMDGMDGFAAGMGVIGFAGFAVLGIQAGDGAFALAGLLTAGAVAGFLVFNFPPAKIFLGDTGSSVLGFMAAGFSLWASREGLFPLWVAVLVFSPFIVDATVTLMRRLIQGERVWQAHKTHYYQRLVQLGWGHRRTVLAEYGVMLLCSLSAVIAVRVSVGFQLGLGAAWLLLYALLIIAIERLERRRSGRLVL